MFFASLLVALSLTLTIVPSHAEDAPVVDNNSTVTYQADLLDKNTTTLRGVLNITGTSEGVDVVVDFWGFPAPYIGPYAYHIHVGRVPEDGNCSAALGHLDPYNRGMSTPCNYTAPETCQIGDLSGKYGSINSSVNSDGHYLDEYTDDYLSTIPGDPAFFGNLSFVVHAANNTRLNCGNFYRLSASTPTPIPTPAASTAPPQQPSASLPATTSSPPLFVGAASSVSGVSPVAMLMALAAFFL